LGTCYCERFDCREWAPRLEHIAFGRWSTRHKGIERHVPGEVEVCELICTREDLAGKGSLIVDNGLEKRTWVDRLQGIVAYGNLIQRNAPTVIPIVDVGPDLALGTQCLVDRITRDDLLCPW
jgi:hypothetical protein